MARTADHEARRQQVTDAALRTIASRGLARTTLSDVADEAGVSVGLVQRYFRAKEDLLRLSIAEIYRRAEERFRAVSVVPPLRDYLLRVTESLLPLDDVRRGELAVWLEFLPATRHDPVLSRMHHEATQGLVEGVVETLEGARRRGEIVPDLDIRSEALSLVALVDGLALHHLATGKLYEGGSTQQALTAAVDHLFERAGA